MEEFRTSLLREKFVIRDSIEDLSDDKPVIALSNRLVVPMTGKRPQDNETFVVRAHNMHTCARVAAMIAREHYDRGPIMSRNKEYRWDDGWRDIVKGYEKQWNPEIWCSVYYKGREVFAAGEHHPFLDVIEKCDVKNKQDYAESLLYAEDAFRQAGKAVTIEHDANVALIVSIKQNEAKCGVILRSPHKTTTFNFSAKPYPGSEHVIKISTSLTVSAAFLEGIQLAFTAGMITKKRNLDLIEKSSEEAQKGERAHDRLANLNRAIINFERQFDVMYRPERPNFVKIVAESEEFAGEFLRPQIEEMIESGELDDDDWIT